MAHRFVELIESGSLSYDNGRTAADRVFAVYNDSTAGGSTLSTADQVTALYGSTDGYGTTLPAYGSPHPTVFGLVAMSPRASRKAGHTDVWEVRWAYRELDWSPTDKQPNEVGYVGKSANGRGEPRDMWVSLTYANIAAMVAEGGNYANGTPASDPGAVLTYSKQIDVAGVPTSVPWRVVEVVLSETASQWPDIGYLTQFVKRRNNVEMGAAAIGMVVYTGWDVSEIDAKLYRISHRFVVDQFCHLLQSPDRVNDGSILLSAPSTISHATNVRAVQPFPDFADFRALSPSIAGALQ